jgi:hypothetical protein
VTTIGFIRDSVHYPRIALGKNRGLDFAWAVFADTTASLPVPLIIGAAGEIRTCGLCTTGFPSIPANLTANEPRALTQCSLIKLPRDRIPVSR